MAALICESCGAPLKIIHIDKPAHVSVAERRILLRLKQRSTDV